MSKNTIKDTDYAFLSIYLRALEAKLLSHERIERILSAKTNEDAAKVLEECGYKSLSALTVSSLENMLSDRRTDVMNELYSLAPDPSIVDVFRVKYDYHNAKVLIKSEAVNVNGENLLSNSGRISPNALSDAYYQESYINLPLIFSDAIQEAKNTLAKTKDPQISDFILDKAYFKEFLALSVATRSKFLAGYAKLSIDSANLRAVVRITRMKSDPAFLRQIFVDGGNIGIEQYIAVFSSKDSLSSIFSGTLLFEAAQAGEEVLQGARLTNFEKLCDNALMSYISTAKLIGFGESVLIEYICAIENELSAVRIIMMGRLAGLPAAVIRERLRDSYV